MCLFSMCGKIQSYRANNQQQSGADHYPKQLELFGLPFASCPVFYIFLSDCVVQLFREAVLLKGKTNPE